MDFLLVNLFEKSNIFLLLSPAVPLEDGVADDDDGEALDVGKTSKMASSDTIGFRSTMLPSVILKIG